MARLNIGVSMSFTCFEITKQMQYITQIKSNVPFFHKNYL